MYQQTLKSWIVGAVKGSLFHAGDISVVSRAVLTRHDLLLMSNQIKVVKNLVERISRIYCTLTKQSNFVRTRFKKSCQKISYCSLKHLAPIKVACVHIRPRRTVFVLRARLLCRKIIRKFFFVRQKSFWSMWNGMLLPCKEMHQQVSVDFLRGRVLHLRVYLACYNQSSGRSTSGNIVHFKPCFVRSEYDNKISGPFGFWTLNLLIMSLALTCYPITTIWNWRSQERRKRDYVVIQGRGVEALYTLSFPLLGETQHWLPGLRGSKK